MAELICIASPFSTQGYKIHSEKHANGAVELFFHGIPESNPDKFIYESYCIFKNLKLISHKS